MNIEDVLPPATTTIVDVMGWPILMIVFFVVVALTTWKPKS
jgi:hypothetical protein